MQLINILEISGTLELLTGLHIGSGNTEMHIGGSDDPVIRHPHTNEPYIPGSSLKGKVRSLLEWRAGLAAINGGSPMSYGALNKAPDAVEARRILKLFGISDQFKDDAQALEIGPSRLAFRDCRLEESWVKQVRDKSQPLTETKMENTIDRVRGVAKDPRNTERVPSGARFDFILSVKVLNMDLDQSDESELLKTLFIGLKLLEMDALGGSGSRGYGRVKFDLADPWKERLVNAQPW
ncbi:MAG: type III-A CRISPR-associated RAMP protein Csm3 [Magnetococcales bacterium]|nr:type III-A CRISPR-associated RAMP protein Csm3 [Magnetococcales bacterium]